MSVRAKGVGKSRRMKSEKLVYQHIETKVTTCFRYGRYMVAAKDIAPGEIILTEEPLTWGPYTTNNVLVCVGCFRSDYGVKISLRSVDSRQLLYH